jgi:hypothetical protein
MIFWIILMTDDDDLIELSKYQVLLNQLHQKIITQRSRTAAEEELFCGQPSPLSYAAPHISGADNALPNANAITIQRLCDACNRLLACTTHSKRRKDSTYPK